MSSRPEAEIFITNQPSSSDLSARLVEGPFRTKTGILSWGLLAVSVYGTALSATLLTAFLAKTVEISFATVVLAAIGQFLSRQAISKKGLNLGSVSMRSWILQPGKLVSDWHTVRLVGFKFLGIGIILATILTLLYTTAVNTLVQPQMRIPSPTTTKLAANVSTGFFNARDYQATCMKTWPETTFYDGTDPSSCVHMKSESTCLGNFVRYFSRWDDVHRLGTATSNPVDRMPIFATAYDNVSVTTAWLDRENSLKQIGDQGRVVENVTVAIPHPKVRDAIQSRDNDLLQPKDLGNVGFYEVTAAVPSMTMNCLCANATRKDVSPLVYEAWPNSLPFNVTFSAVNLTSLGWPVVGGQAYSNATVLDDMFGWEDYSQKFVNGKKEELKHTRPSFTQFPGQGNTIYILGQAQNGEESGVQEKDFWICSMQAGLTSRCATRYSVSSDGSRIESLCDENAHGMAYRNINTSAIDIPALPDWRDIGFDNSAALELDSGIRGGGSSFVQLLNKLYLRNASLSPALPSPAESLLSAMICGMLDLPGDIPFGLDWDDTSETLDEPITQHFTASVQIAQYMSGGKYPYQKAFLVVLALVFLINLALLGYFISLRLDLVNDLCEPLVLFLVGYRTLPGGLFHGLTKDGVHKKDLATEWVLQQTEDDFVIAGKCEDTTQDNSIDSKNPRSMVREA